MSIEMFTKTNPGVNMYHDVMFFIPWLCSMRTKIRKKIKIKLSNILKWQNCVSKCVLRFVRIPQLDIKTYFRHIRNNLITTSSPIISKHWMRRIIFPKQTMLNDTDRSIFLCDLSPLKCLRIALSLLCLRATFSQ